MLRIDVSGSAAAITFKLEGRLSGAWVDEFERAWYEFTSGPSKKSVIVDLSGVDFIDAQGKKLLGWMLRQGAELRNGRLLTRFIVDQMKGELKGVESGFHGGSKCTHPMVLN